jgi:DNA (cytosine-5)-methyltransferase 1
VAGVKDDESSATLFSWNALILAVKPRVATMEQTLGLIQIFPDHFRAVFQDFLSFGYSVRWKAFDFLEYGVPQKRRRIVLLAAGPGEILPPFPRPTHGPGLEPFASIGSAIDSIPLTATNHSPRTGRGGEPYPMNGPVRSCITTSGQQDRNYHPDGSRPLTCREFAACQKFPHDFQFCGTASQVLKQIGNAVGNGRILKILECTNVSQVPPIFAEALFCEVIESLQSGDGVSGTTSSQGRLGLGG